MNEALKNILKSIPFVRNTLNNYQLSHNKNGIASYRITKRKIQRFIDLLNNDYPQVHINLLCIGARGGWNNCSIAVQNIWGALANFNNKTTYGIEPEPSEAERLLKSGEFDKIYPYAIYNHTGPATLYITNWIGCSGITEPNTEFLNQYHSEWADWWTTTKTASVQVKAPQDILEDIPYDYCNSGLMGPEYEIFSAMHDSFFQRSTCIQLLTHAIPFYKNQHTFGDIFNFFKDKHFIPISIVKNPLFSDLEVHHTLTFVKSPTEIKTLDQLLKHCLIGMMLQKPYYVSYLLNKFRSLFPNEQAYRKIWRYV
ncbi:MAG: hypothetical protein MJ218_02105 [Opitutales bacterium]|nr:hypothetical protein [Opitutales bacterium]